MPQDTNNAITLCRPPHGTFYLDVSGSYTIQVQLFKRPP